MPPQYNLPTATEKHYYWLCLKAREKPLEQLSEDVSQYEIDMEARKKSGLLGRLIGHFTYRGQLSHEDYQLSKRILKEKLTGEIEPTTSDVLIDNLGTGFRAWKNYPITLFIKGYKEARHGNALNYCKYKALDLTLKLTEGVSAAWLGFTVFGEENKELSFVAGSLSGLIVLGLRNSQLTNYIKNREDRKKIKYQKEI